MLSPPPPIPGMASRFFYISIVVGAKSNPLPTLEHNLDRDARSMIKKGTFSFCKVIAAIKPQGPAPAIITGSFCWEGVDDESFDDDIMMDQIDR